MSGINKPNNKYFFEALWETLLHLPQLRDHNSKCRSKNLVKGSKGKDDYFLCLFFSNPFFFLCTAVSLLSLSVILFWKKWPSVEVLTEGQNLKNSGVKTHSTLLLSGLLSGTEKITPPLSESLTVASSSSFWSICILDACQHLLISLAVEIVAIPNPCRWRHIFCLIWKISGR